ncbi:hypothetical protein D3C80_1716770 [compost metagenome]
MQQRFIGAQLGAEQQQIGKITDDVVTARNIGSAEKGRYVDTQRGLPETFHHCQAEQCKEKRA